MEPIRSLLRKSRYLVGQIIYLLLYPQPYPWRPPPVTINRLRADHYYLYRSWVSNHCLGYAGAALKETLAPRNSWNSP